MKNNPQEIRGRGVGIIQINTTDRDSLHNQYNNPNNKEWINNYKKYVAFYNL